MSSHFEATAPAFWPAMGGDSPWWLVSMSSGKGFVFVVKYVEVQSLFRLSFLILARNDDGHRSLNCYHEARSRRRMPYHTGQSNTLPPGPPLQCFSDTDGVLASLHAAALSCSYPHPPRTVYSRCFQVYVSVFVLVVVSTLI
jgi:hypothetical protein